jgi:hypothetical protein
MTSQTLIIASLVSMLASSSDAGAEPNAETDVEAPAVAEDSALEHQHPPSPSMARRPDPDVGITPTRLPAHDCGSKKEQKALILAGTLTIGIPYMVTSLAGAIAIDKAQDARRRTYGRALLVPVVGPFAAIPHTDSAVSRWGAAFSGILQVAAVGLVTAGVIATVRRKRTRRLGMTASLQPGGGSVGLSGRF